VKVLHATSELYPLIKTGGLADVSNSLPNALKAHGADVRILLPGYREVLQNIDDFHIIGWSTVQTAGKLRHVRILEVMPDGFEVPVWLADCADLFDRPGNPYVNADGFDWPDNAERYTCFSQVAAQIGAGQIGLDWQPEVVHSHDWQTGLVAAFLSELADPPRTVFTIHNLSYTGYFSHKEYMHLQLPMRWWHPEGVEFYGGFSMLKTAIVYSDVVTTVSPTYAKEILTPTFGYGMEGVLQHYQGKLTGILNGLDTHTWDPSVDPMLVQNYGIKDRQEGKAANRQALLKSLDIENTDIWMDRPLFGSVGRLVEQKGIDILTSAIPRLLKEHNAGFIFIGEGQHHFVKQLESLQTRYPDHVRLFNGYSEIEAHLVEAGSDFFLMPSRFEPCGLNQLYSLRYGTLPVVHHVGGLADTVVDASPENIKHKTATGLVFYQPTTVELHGALVRAMELYEHPKRWAQVQKTAMQQNFDWHHSAEQYLSLYT
jgi:starch synthase